MGIWEREDSRITLGFLVPVTLWPMVPYLETQNTAEDTGLEQRRGKRWRWERKGNGLKGTLDPNCAVQFETCWNWGTYRTSNEMSNTNGSRGLEFRREVHGCGYRPRMRENFPEEARDELRTQEWLRARWRGRGRVSGSRDCLHSDLDPKAWEKLLLLWLSGLHSEDSEENGDSCKTQCAHFCLHLLWVPRRAGRERAWPGHKGPSRGN